MEEIIEGEISFKLEGRTRTCTFESGRGSCDGIKVELVLTGGSYEVVVNSGTWEIEFVGLKLFLPWHYKTEQTVFVNGFQSWTESREYALDEKLPRLKSPVPKLINNSGDYTFFPMKGKKGYLHSHDHTYVRDSNKATIWKDQLPQLGYTIFEHQVKEGRMVVFKDLAGWKFSGKEKVFEVSRDENEVWRALESTFQEDEPIGGRTPVTGWTSWYYYYTDISEQVIQRNLDAFAKRQVPIDFFQIDDGWQASLGEWMESNEKFPSGMGDLANKIHDQGYKAGLWLAPFIVSQTSKVFLEHPEWLITYDGEQYLTGGYNPGWASVMKGYYYVLDIYQEPVREYLRKTFDQVLKVWGYDLVKLDFLYAVARIPRLGKSRSMQMHEAMDFLRECVGEKLIIGCGVPLTAAYGKVEYCRIGADVSLGWDMKSLAVMNFRERPSTHNTLRTTIARKHMSGRAFFNDPDVFILRENKTKMNQDQKLSLFTINLALGDLVFTSDCLDEYDPETLALYLSQFPNRYKEVISIRQDGELYQVQFFVDELFYTLAANLSGKKALFRPPGEWNFEVDRGIFKSEEIELQAHQTQVFLHLDEPGQTILGSTGHIFPGADIEKIRLERGEVKVQYHELAQGTGSVWVQIDDLQVKRVEFQRQSLPVETAGPIRYVRLP